MIQRANPQHQPTAYVYARSSHRDNSTGDQIPAQCERSEQFYLDELRDQGIDWGGYLTDPITSASKKEFAKRPAGIQLMEKLQTGDHVVIDHTDRFVRNLFDWADMQRWFNDHQISLHLLDINGGTTIDTDNIHHMMQLTMIVLIAHAESDRISKRIRKQKERDREAGKFCGAHPPMGSKIVVTPITDVNGNPVLKADGTQKAYKKLVWDPKIRGYMTRIVNLRNQKDMHFSKIIARAQKEQWEWPHLFHKYKVNHGDKYTILAYIRELMIRKVGATRPSDIQVSKLAKEGDYPRCLHEIDKHEYAMVWPDWTEEEFREWRKAAGESGYASIKMSTPPKQPRQKHPGNVESTEPELQLLHKLQMYAKRKPTVGELVDAKG